MSYLERENPLQNHLILENIFGHCSVPTLKNCREVCKLWNELSHKSWRMKATLTLNVSRLYDDDESEMDFYNRPGKVFQRYKILSMELRSPRVLEKVLSNEIGSHMKHLEINNCAFQSVPIFMQALCRNAPNLRSLVITEDIISNSIKCRRRRDGGQLDNLPLPIAYLESLKSLEVCLVYKIDLKTVLPYVPNLEALTIKHGNDNRGLSLTAAYRSLFTGIKDIRDKDSNKLKLKKLDLLNFYPRSIRWLSSNMSFKPDALLIKDLPLEHLCMDFGANTNDDNVRMILKHFAPTLRILEGYRGYGDGDRFFASLSLFFRGCYNLEELYLWGRFDMCLIDLWMMKNLKTLSINHFNERISYKFSEPLLRYKPWRSHYLLRFRNYSVMKNLHTLELNYKVSAQQILTLSKIMPYLTVIKAVFINETLVDASRLWPKLREVKTMLESNVCDDVMKKLKTLKYLHTFEDETCCHQAKLTKDGIFTGIFVAMPALETLAIHVSPEVDDETISEVHNRIRFAKVLRDCAISQPSTSRRNCCKLLLLHC